MRLIVHDGCITKNWYYITPVGLSSFGLASGIGFTACRLYLDRFGFEQHSTNQVSIYAVLLTGVGCLSSSHHHYNINRLWKRPCRASPARKHGKFVIKLRVSIDCQAAAQGMRVWHEQWPPCSGGTISRLTVNGSSSSVMVASIVWRTPLGAKNLHIWAKLVQISLQRLIQHSLGCWRLYHLSCLYIHFHLFFFIIFSQIILSIFFIKLLFVSNCWFCWRVLPKP